MLDILIKGATVVDGTGAPGYKADLGVAGRQVVLIANCIEQEAGRVIDASDLVLAPGFIDPHSHSDLTLLVDGRAESKVRQGVTTEVIGNCGSSPAPLRGMALQEATAEAAELDLALDWTDTAGYIAALRRRGIAVNVVPLIGHNTLRGSVLGYDDVQPTPERQAEMERLVIEAMQQGAHGLSTGLYYPPGGYARLEEVIALARVVASYGGIYTSHIRSESDGWGAAVDEAIEVARQAGVPVEISHLKLECARNFGAVEALLGKLDAAQAEGLAVGADQYPYNASATWLAAILPPWAQQGSKSEIAARLRDAGQRLRLRQDYRQNLSEWEDRSGVADWSGILITEYGARPDLPGKTIAEIAAERKTDPFETALDLIAESSCMVSCVYFSQSEENVRRIMRHPAVAVCSDGSSFSPQGVLGTGKPHPRNYGTFARVLGRYVREEKNLSLEEAVRKMTSLSAVRFGLTGRGVIALGAWADLVLFDPANVSDCATFTNPHQFAKGIPYVIVNGTLAIDAGQHTGALAGRVL